MGAFSISVMLWLFVVIRLRVACLSVDWFLDNGYMLKELQRDNSAEGDRNLMMLQGMLYNGTIAEFSLYNERLPLGAKIDARSKDNFTHFVPSAHTKVIIHGYLDSSSIAQWMHDMKDEFLKGRDYNVIIVDWSSGNLIYTLAVVNTKRVGKEVADLIRILQKDYGANPENFHLLGHSLGSHVAGFVGENIKSIGRITGLDPASTPFEKAGPRYRLDPTDALLVDVIHSGSIVIGMREPIGHFDFYPNGGVIQPGCTPENFVRTFFQRGLLEGARNLLCSHMRAPLFYTASINSNCQMLGVKCEDWETFENGGCRNCSATGDCAVMGDYANSITTGNSTNKYYLMVGSNRPYCVYQYHILLEKIGKKSRQFLSSWPLTNLWKRALGPIVYKISISGTKGKMEFSLKESPEQGDKISHLLQSPTDFRLITEVVIEWSLLSLDLVQLLSSLNLLQQPIAPQLKMIQITPLFINPRRKEVYQTAIFCSNNRTTSETGSGKGTVIMKMEFC